MILEMLGQFVSLPADGGVLEDYLQWPQAKGLIEHLADQPFTFAAV